MGANSIFVLTLKLHADHLFGIDFESHLKEKKKKNLKQEISDSH